MDLWLIAHGMTHPDLWMMWAGILLSAINTVGLVLLWRRYVEIRNHQR